MKNNNIIFRELKDISPLIVQINQTNPYSVSSFYFDNLSTDILKKIKLSKKVLYDSKPVTPYSIPKGYFKNLPELLLQRIDSEQQYANEVFEETESIAPILNTISKNQVYKTPDDFFERWKAPDITTQKQEAIVVPLRRSSKILRFSAASAAAILFFTVGIYTISKRYNEPSEVNTAKIKVKNLSKDEIVHYLKSHIPAQNVTSASKYTSKYQNTIKRSLKEVSDKEIQQFLKETGESDEI